MDLAALQETTGSREEQIDNKDFVMMYSRDDKQGRNDVALIMINKLKSNVLNFKPLIEGIQYIRIKPNRKT